jgi:hypothetical protein
MFGYKKIYCIDAFDKTYLWGLDVGSLPSESFAIANGKVYVPLYLYGLMCFGGANHPPSQPQRPLGPVEGNVGTEYIFSTMATDNIDYNDIQYGWDWNGDNDVDEWTAFYPNGQAVDTPHTWNTPGSYAIKVIARDRNNGLSDWSEPLSVLISYDLEIAEIKGGIFVRVAITNVGETDASDVSYTIRCDGGLILFPRGGFTDGEISKIAAGKQGVARSAVIGFGKTTVTVELTVADVVTDSKSVSAFIFGFFVIISDTG